MKISILINEESYCWNKDVETTKKFLKIQEDYANRKLRKNGHLFLNEVYRMIGYPTDEEGFLIGWITSDSVTFNIEGNNINPYFLLVLEPDGNIRGLT